jgi:AcrR family transcriptional regulator
MTRLLKTSRNRQQNEAETPRRPGKKERTRQEIYRAAMKLFAESDYEKVTIEDICAEAGIAKATFFLHFAGKSALIGVFNEEITRSLTERLAGYEGSAEEELLLLVSVLREAWETNAPVMHKMLREFLDQPALVSKAAAVNESLSRTSSRAGRSAANFLPTIRLKWPPLRWSRHGAPSPPGGCKTRTWTGQTSTGRYSPCNSTASRTRAERNIIKPLREKHNGQTAQRHFPRALPPRR